MKFGIIVAALGKDGDAYILADYSCKDRAEGWARRAVDAFHKFKADCIVAETNYRRRHGERDDPCAGLECAGARRDRKPRQGRPCRADLAALRQRPGASRRPVRENWRSNSGAFTGSGYHGHGSPDHADAAIWALTHLFEAEGRHRADRLLRELGAYAVIEPQLPSPQGGGEESTQTLEPNQMVDRGSGRASWNARPLSGQSFLCPRAQRPRGAGRRLVRSAGPAGT